MCAYELIRHTSVEQTEDNLSHIGGLPNLPPNQELPKCKLCHSSMTFFFQIEFPKRHAWTGRVMVVFECTSCAVRGYLTPPMAPNRIHIPDYFLDEYEKNFCVINFEKKHAVVRREYTPVLKYESIELKLKTASARITKVGGKPNWHIANDFPESYLGSRFVFLMQIWDDWEFSKTKEAPLQTEYPWLGDPYRRDGKYALFGGLPLYFFGTLDLEQPKVYLMNQK